MVNWNSVLSLAWTAFVSTAAALKVTAPDIVPGAFIAEFEDGHSTENFYNTLGSNAVAVNRRLKLDYKLFKGASFQLKNVSDVDAAAQQIAGMAAVKKLWPVRRIPLPKDTVHYTGTDRLKAEAVVSKTKRQAANTTDTFSTHVMTQVDQLRAEGVTGKGIKIGVIDTGIDYTHPALGGAFGPGNLVSYGTDLVGDGYTGFNTPVPDDDPVDHCQGHGTHVAGTIAAQANQFGFTGAAPGVTLGAYRVFGCPEDGQAANDVLIKAYNLAYEDGSDIITASIGGASGWSEDAWAVVVQRIVEAGVPCTVSAGNSGSQGLFYASTAANGKKVTAIASVDNTEAPMILLSASFTTANSSSESFGWTAGAPDTWGNVSLPLWTPSYNTSDPAAGCEDYPADTPDLSGKIVLIRRGRCTFISKALNAASHGAKYILFYNNAAGVISVAANAGGIEGVGMVTAEQGVEWIDLLAQNVTVTVNIVDPTVAQTILSGSPNTVTGGFLSTFTSWGPTYEVDLKPQFSAPGGLILSTWPVALGSYAVISGTSMACPLAAGVVALIAQVRGTLDPATIENALAGTANPNLFNDGARTYPFLAPAPQQGAGLIQAYDAAHATTLLSVSSLSFNDTANFVSSTNFTISNTGSKEVTYALSNVLAATGYTLEANSIHPAIFPNELVSEGATLKFSEEKVTIPAGGNAVVTVAPTAPAGLTASRLPVYSGYIALNSTDGQSLSLPYIGVAGSLHDATVLDKDITYLTQTSDPALNPAPANTSFVIPKSSNSTTANLPAIGITLALGSALVRVDVVPQNSSTNATEILGVKSLGNIFGFPAEYQPRAGAASSWDGLLEDGSFAPAGGYTLLVRALRIFGDRTKAEEYDVKETVPFTISYS
ncbi:subtilisin-like protein [Byssothecium circinans]|uniref:Subtilisin-like protein n=1 Tax=Byssothecium circinans TaxID=147558 RepID=A0A6A5T8U4_9PLEO|nr:subtilisin-like protein [Byssothecium circinans]